MWFEGNSVESYDTGTINYTNSNEATTNATSTTVPNVELNDNPAYETKTLLHRNLAYEDCSNLRSTSEQVYDEIQPAGEEIEGEYQHLNRALTDKNWEVTCIYGFYTDITVQVIIMHDDVADAQLIIITKPTAQLKTQHSPTAYNINTS